LKRFGDANTFEFGDVFVDRTERSDRDDVVVQLADEELTPGEIDVSTCFRSSSYGPISALASI